LNNLVREGYGTLYGAGELQNMLRANTFDPFEHRDFGKKSLARLRSIFLTEDEIISLIKSERPDLHEGLKRMSENILATGLEAIIENAIEGNATAVELEYVDGGLEIMIMFGNSGIGTVMEDGELIEETIGMLIEKAGLEEETRGEMEWQYKGKMYRIRVQEYENFGETAYRLKFVKGNTQGRPVRTR
jgi:hypothetical protein